jgi:ribonuclease G
LKEPWNKLKVYTFKFVLCFGDKVYNLKKTVMNSELVIDVQASQIQIALLEEKRLVECHRENRTGAFSVGDIYLGNVRKMMPGLNAAFVDVGFDKGAFLHYQDLGPQFASLMAFIKEAVSNAKSNKKPPALSKMQLQKDINKTGSITEVLTQGQEVLVQISKEAISTKGPRLTSELSIAGRLIVLMPFSDKVYVSQKIKSADERNRIKQLIKSIKPRNFGVIVRTVAEGKKVAELDGELKTLLKRWEDGIARIGKTKPPVLLHQEIGRMVGILRDILTPSFESIYVNDKGVYEEIRDYVKTIAPDRLGIVNLYEGELPIFDHFAITKQIKSAFGRTVSFKNGAYLIVEHTEAMHVIDVNSGNKSKAANDQETNALEVNLAAADEIARQLRLRNMGGIIVIDFIDMTNAENRQKLHERMRDNMLLDRAKHNILPLSKFGLMQITRQRVRPEMYIDTEEVCPTCYGKGISQPSVLFVDSLENKIDYLVNVLKIKKFKLMVHPYVAAFINKGFPFFTLKWKWKRKYSSSFSLIPSQELAFLQYQFIDESGNELDLKEEVETVSVSPRRRR